MTGGVEEGEEEKEEEGGRGKGQAMPWEQLISLLRGQGHLRMTQVYSWPLYYSCTRNRMN